MRRVGAPSRKTMGSGVALMIFSVLAFSAYWFPANQGGNTIEAEDQPVEVKGATAMPVAADVQLRNKKKPAPARKEEKVGNADTGVADTTTHKKKDDGESKKVAPKQEQAHAGFPVMADGEIGFDCSIIPKSARGGEPKIANYWKGASPGNTSNSTPSLEDDRQCCHAIDKDTDYGLSLFHYMTRMWCTQFLHDNHQSGGAPKVLQIGANTGDNANDPLVKFLKQDVADAVLFEPVPWVFKELSKTYENYRGHVKLYNAAISQQRGGNVSFEAPKKEAKGWVPQMGGLSIPEKSKRTIAKKGLGKYFETIQVPSFTVESLMEDVGWTEMPDVVVIDTEGFDAHVVRMLLAEVDRRQAAAQENTPVRPIRIIQYEWKHLKPSVREELQVELANLGYCVVQVHYDDVAIHNDWGRALDMRETDKAGGGKKVPLDDCQTTFKLTKKRKKD